MRFPQTFIDDLRRQADIVRIISDYIPLKKKGANWMACCPFHQEKTPSFSVNPAKDIFYCFGCSKGGSVFNFVMEHERLSFPEAIRVVAEKAGVPLPAMEEDERSQRRKREGDTVIKLNSWALEWWEEQLRLDTPEAEAAREYIKNRGITDETTTLFRLGYAPDRWDGLTSELQKRGATTSEIEHSGLAVKKDRGGFYDRFRGRLIFPVMDAQGRPVAFGGRTFVPDGEPKYLNSPETTAYVKGRHLYGLHLSRDEIRRKRFVILVEGYLDLIIPYQHGVRNVVASLGTALTPEQAKLVSRFARQVVVNYDGDSAGIQAAKRATEALLAEDFEVKVLVLPEGADPDEFVRKFGVEAYQERRGKALPHIQFVLDQAVRSRDLLRPAEKAQAVEEVLPFVRAVRNPIQKREYFDMVMGSLRVEDADLRIVWQRTIAKQAPGSDRSDDTRIKEKSARMAAHAQPTIAEQQLLDLIAHDQELRHRILPQLEAADYQELSTAAVFTALKKHGESQAPLNFAALTEELENDPVAADYIAFLSMGERQRAQGEAIDEVLAKAETCFAALRIMRIERRLRELKAELAIAEREGRLEEFARLDSEHLDLARLRSQIMSRTEAATIK